MWRISLAIGVLLAIGLPVHGEQESGQSGGDQQHTDGRPNPPPPPSAKAKCVIKQDGTTIECDWAQTDTPSYLRRLFAAESLPNLLLVGVGLGGICAAFFTLHKIERQIKVAEADTQAMIRAERAWIVPSVKEISSGVYIYSVKNEGNTPAKVQSIYCVNLWLRRGEELYIPPEETTALGLIQFPPFLLPPKAEKAIWRVERAGIEKMSGGGEGERSNFVRGFGTSRTYGRILYRDVLDDDPTHPLHETCLLYILIPQPGTVPVPDPFYPKHNDYS
jgi:hypothetical protein